MRSQWDMQDRMLDVGTMYCIGRNYAAHAAEMGAVVPTDPIVFIKPPTAYRPSGSTITLPSWSSDVHHEVEMVIVIGADADTIDEDDASSIIAGIGVGLDLTARDVQSAAKKRGEPWAVSKGWKGAAPVSAIQQVALSRSWELTLEVNGELRQRGSTQNMERSVPSLVSYVASVFGLRAGDAIFTGTPEGVASLKRGDHAVARLGDLSTLDVRFA